MSRAYRDGWEQVFGAKPAPKVTRHPFPLRRGMVINVDLPSDLRLRDLRRFTQYLATMCDDWEVEMGLPVLMFSTTGAVAAATCVRCAALAVRVVSRDCTGTDHASLNMGSPLCADHCCIECDPCPDATRTASATGSAG